MFSSMFGGSPGGALGGASPSAFTSPGMSPATLALLLGMQAAGAPQLPSVQSAGAANGPGQPLPAIQPQSASQPQQSPTANANPLAALMGNPQIMALLRSLGAGSHQASPIFGGGPNVNMTPGFGAAAPPVTLPFNIPGMGNMGL